MTHYCGTCGFISCSACEHSGVIHHPHFTVPMALSIRPLDPDFWRTLAKAEMNWACDSCTKPFYSGISRYIECAACKNHGFCHDCINDCKIAPDKWAHDCAGGKGALGSLAFSYMDIEEVTDEYTARQVGLANAEKARLEAEVARQQQEAKAAAAAAATRRNSAPQPKAPTVQRKAVASPFSPVSPTFPVAPVQRQASLPVQAATSLPAQSARSLPVRPAATKPQQASHPQAHPQQASHPQAHPQQASRPQAHPQQRRQSSQTGQFLKTLGVGLVKGVVKANNASNSGGGGGWFGDGGDGGGGDSGSGGVDLSGANLVVQAGLQSNVWDSINAAANWTTQ